MISIFSCLGIALTAVLLLRYLFQAKDAKIRNIPEVPGWPVVGNLLQLRWAGSPSGKFEEWAQKYGPVYQVRLGVYRVIVANSYDSLKQLWIDNQSSMINRPTLYTFHSLVSSSQGFTIGSTPWDQSCKRRRKSAARVLNAGAVQSYMPAISTESDGSISDLYRDAQAHGIIHPKLYFKKFVLNMSLTVSFGTRLSSVRDEALKEIVEVEEALTRFRSHTHNLQDYLPFMRIIPTGTNEKAEHYRVRRDRYMNMLLDQLRKDIKEGVDIPCSVGTVLKSVESEGFTETELRSISLTLLSAGLDTIPTNLIQGVAFLASSQGQEIQNKLLEDLMNTYETFDNAWDSIISEDKAPYLKAFVQEVLRYYCVVPMGFPRSNISPFTYGDAEFPTGTRFYMNARAANFDPAKFHNPDVFDPARFMHADEKAAGTAMPHYTFGAGTRMCVGFRLATRLMYVMFGRMVLAWKIGAVGEPVIDPKTYNECETSLVAEPPDFECKLEPRDMAKAKLESLANLSQKTGRWQGW
ncbi:cytochrome P450 [Geopyxis carbonaria]|nr:cytochrome P450 [Geopyxis carbonaria]